MSLATSEEIIFFNVEAFSGNLVPRSPGLSPFRL